MQPSGKEGQFLWYWGQAVIVSANLLPYLHAIVGALNRVGQLSCLQLLCSSALRAPSGCVHLLYATKRSRANAAAVDTYGDTGKPHHLFFGDSERYLPGLTYEAPPFFSAAAAAAEQQSASRLGAALDSDDFGDPELRAFFTGGLDAAIAQSLRRPLTEAESRHARSGRKLMLILKGEERARRWRPVRLHAVHACGRPRSVIFASPPNHAAPADDPESTIISPSNCLVLAFIYAPVRSHPLYTSPADMVQKMMDRDAFLRVGEQHCAADRVCALNFGLMHRHSWMN